MLEPDSWLSDTLVGVVIPLAISAATKSKQYVLARSLASIATETPSKGKCIVTIGELLFDLDLLEFQ